MSYYLQTLDSIGDDGRNRTCDPQFRKRARDLKFYSQKRLETQCSCALGGISIGKSVCLRFKQFYLVLLGFTRLTGEKLGKTAALIVSALSVLKSYLIDFLNSNFSFSRGARGHL